MGKLTVNEAEDLKKKGLLDNKALKEMQDNGQVYKGKASAENK